MATSDSPALVDTNVLVYALLPDVSEHTASRALLDRAQNGDAALCVTPQVFAEFYAVVTDSRRVTVPRQPAEALDAIRKYLALPGLRLLPVPDDVVTRWVKLVEDHPVKRGGVFDRQLAATMLGNGVTRIYTYNRPDFEVLEGIQVLTP
jgi:toxin-antitoxin system PIN domain toxin